MGLAEILPLRVGRGFTGPDAANSLLPIRRANISSSPATVSKYHRPEEFWPKGIGKA
jgi:hypothetical protein